MPRQIGWSQESNLLYNISMQLDRLAAVTAASGGGGGGGTITGGGAAGQVTFWDAATNITGSNNLFWNNATSRLGIGTPTPISILNISSNGGRLSLTQNAAGSIFNGIDFVSSIGGAYASIIGNQNTGEIRLSAVATYFYTIYGGGSERMRITSTGNVGIGNINPTYTLDVNGTGRYQDNLLISKNQNATTFARVVNTTSGTSSYAEFVIESNSTSGVAAFGKSSSTSNQVGIISPNNFYIFNTTAGDIAINNQFATGTIKFAIGSSTTAQMTLFSTGNLGIGTTSDATYKLDVNGTSIFRNDVIMSSSGAGNTLSITSNVTSTPLLINAQGSGTGAFEIQNLGLRRLRILVTSTNTTFEQSNQTGGFVFGANSTFNGDVSIAGKLALTVVANRQTVNYSLVLADNGKLVEMNVGAANTLTVPPNSSITFPIGTKIDIAQYGAGQTSIVPGAGVTVRSALGALKLAAQYSGASLVKIGTDEWYLFGDITV